MIDRKKRDLLIKNIVKLLDGSLTVKEYEKINLNSDDQAVVEIVLEVSWFCDDIISSFSTQKVFIKYEECFKRFILFLSTDLEYEWPYPYPTFKYRFKRLCTLLTFGFLSCIREQQYEDYGDFEVWPFLRKEDFKKETCLQRGSRPRYVRRCPTVSDGCPTGYCPTGSDPM
jgi:hypothetical protein